MTPLGLDLLPFFFQNYWNTSRQWTGNVGNHDATSSIVQGTNHKIWLHWRPNWSPLRGRCCFLRMTMWQNTCAIVKITVQHTEIIQSTWYISPTLLASSFAATFLYFGTCCRNTLQGFGRTSATAVSLETWKQSAGSKEVKINHSGDWKRQLAGSDVLAAWKPKLMERRTVGDPRGDYCATFFFSFFISFSWAVQVFMFTLILYSDLISSKLIS